MGILAMGSRSGLSDGLQQTGTSLRNHVEFLASDDLGGRLTGTTGAGKAADYIIGQLKEIGATPILDSGGYRLPFEFTSGITDIGSRFFASGNALQAPVRSREGQIRALTFSDTGQVSGPLVFAGYGITIPDNVDYPYDNFATLDVQGKIVVVFRYMPEDVDQETRAIMGRFTDPRYKAMRARELGAKALIVVTGPRSPNAGELVPMAFDAAAAGSGIIAASISGDIAETLFATASAKSLREIQEEFDTGNPHTPGFDIPDIEVTLDVKVQRERSNGYNVVGYLPPSIPAAVERDRSYVMLGAHYDHLGLGIGGNSLARGNEVGNVHNGADDNASGVAAVLQAGSQLAAMPRERGVVLAFWSGEEFGLLGAHAFVQSEVLPADQLAAYINFDMVGRVRDNVVTIQAVGSSDAWPSLIERTNVPIGFDIRTQQDPWLPTDSMAFNLVDVPTLSFFSGSHEQYHRPSDDSDLINYEDLERVARFGALLARRVANLNEAPAFVTVTRSVEGAGSRDIVRVFTGTIPDYAAEEDGLLLGGVIEGGPAEGAGLRRGDVIIEFAGVMITNIYDYTAALAAIKVDVPVAVVYMRDGQRIETELIPRARQ